jgi:AraC-like DNA-binding protein
VRGHLLVFPRTSVVIHQAGHAPVVADPTRVILYNRGQEYTRRALSERGDECEWFALPPSLLAAVMREHDAGVDDRLDRPFTWTHGAIDPATYLLQRRVSQHLLRSPSPSRLFVEESIVLLAARCAVPPGATRAVRRETTAREHRDLAEACRVLLARHLGERLSLLEVAAHVGASPFHLARVFRQDTGLSLSDYAHRLRLQTALERVMDGDDLARVAADLGYASHSHFTALFRRAFGASPSAVRRNEHDRDSGRPRLARML